MSVGVFNILNGSPTPKVTAGYLIAGKAGDNWYTALGRADEKVLDIVMKAPEFEPMNNYLDANKENTKLIPWIYCKDGLTKNTEEFLKSLAKNGYDLCVLVNQKNFTAYQTGEKIEKQNIEVKPISDVAAEDAIRNFMDFVIRSKK